MLHEVDAQRGQDQGEQLDALALVVSRGAEGGWVQMGACERVKL